MMQLSAENLTFLLPADDIFHPLTSLGDGPNLIRGSIEVPPSSLGYSRYYGRQNMEQFVEQRTRNQMM